MMGMPGGGGGGGVLMGVDDRVFGQAVDGIFQSFAPACTHGKVHGKYKKLRK